MLPFIVLGATDTTIESNIENQDDAIQSWLDNHGGATASGFCGELMWSHNFSDLSNECGITGNAVVTFMATDECGTAETTATVNVVDSSPPLFLNQPTDLIVECNGTGNQADLIPWLIDHGGAVAQDNGGNITWSNDYATLNDSCGSSGNASVIFTATDECDNYSTTYATFTVEDHFSPMISVAAQDTFIECGLPNTQATLQNYLDRQGGAQASDLCGNIAWTNDFPLVVDTCHASTNVSVNFTAMDECGNNDSTTAIVTLMGTSGTAVSQLNEFALRVSPNPAHHALKIVFDKNEILPTQLSLFNSFGLPILSQNITAEVIDIPVSGYPPGVYYLRAKTVKGIYTSKIVIE